MKSNHRRFLKFPHTHFTLLLVLGSLYRTTNIIATTALRIGRLSWSECLQPFERRTGPRNFITNWSNALTVNPIFAYFKFLTNLRAAVRQYQLPIRTSVLKFAPPPKKSASCSGRSRPHLIPWWNSLGQDAIYVAMAASYAIHRVTVT